ARRPQRHLRNHPRQHRPASPHRTAACGEWRDVVKNEPTDHAQVPASGSGDPSALPLFADAPTRPGRVRGTFTMTPDTTTAPSTARAEPAAPAVLNGHHNSRINGHGVNGSSSGLYGGSVPAGDRGWVKQEGIDW